MFKEIDSLKVELPRLNSISKEVGKQKLNFYQKFAVIMFLVIFALAVIIGNLFPVCSATGGILGNNCVTTEFNFSLMFMIWFISFIVCLFIFAIGHIIAILTSIDKKLSKNIKK